MGGHDDFAREYLVQQQRISHLEKGLVLALLGYAFGWWMSRGAAQDLHGPAVRNDIALTVICKDGVIKERSLD